MNLDVIKTYKALLVGDGIYDRYVFVKPLGKSIKEPVISVAHLREEEYRGGVWAAANHLHNFCAQVDVYCGSRVMVNTRFVEDIYKRKLFTLHESRIEENGPLPDIASYDVVIVSDFGHGTMTKELIEKIYKEARFLAVNAQTNSQNFGFNLVTRYSRADLVVVDELEARLAASDKDSPIEDVILELGYRSIIVTLGANGAIGFNGGFERLKPSFDAPSAIDTMGAGDAFLSIVAPYAAARCSMRELLQIGNAAGAAKCQIIGHRRSITPADVNAWIKLGND